MTTACDSANLPASYPVKLITRWHQAAVLFSLVLMSAIFVGGFIGMMLLDAPMALALLGAIAAAPLGTLPGFLIYRVMPSKRTATVHADGVHFTGLGDVPYASLISYNTDDYLKLRRVSGTTLIIMGQSNKLLAEYPKFRNALLRSIADWKKRQPPGEHVPQRAYFYGSTGARLLGALVLLSALGILITLIRMHQPPASAYFIVPMAIGLGIRLMLGKRKR